MKSAAQFGHMKIQIQDSQYRIRREAGFDASYMKVGHSGWRAAGAPIKMFE